MKKNKYDTVILAAGVSKRFKHKKNKQFIKFNNKNIIDIVLKKFIKINEIDKIHLVLPKKYIKEYAKKYKTLSIIAGGKSRAQSVYNALSFLHSINYNKSNILIHDAARPCVDQSDIVKLIKIASKLSTGLSLGYPITNALKLVKKDEVKYNIEKNNMWSTFTPQIFNFYKLYNSYKYIIKNKINIDDDVEAMTINSHKIKILISSPGNIKLTYKEDVSTIEKLLK